MLTAEEELNEAAGWPLHPTPSSRRRKVSTTTTTSQTGSATWSSQHASPNHRNCQYPNVRQARAVGQAPETFKRDRHAEGR
jgi:hypothetical protein